jgi:hypothetical protein
VGFSWGGVLAYETAVRLARESDHAPLVILIESLAPWETFSAYDRVLHALRTLPGWTIRRGLMGWLRRLRRAWQGGRHSSAAPEPEPELGDGSTQSIERRFLRLAERHAVTPEPRLTIHLIRATVAWPPVTPMDDLHKLRGDYCWRQASGGRVCVHRIRGRGRVELLRQPQSRDVAGFDHEHLRCG